jgi:hypothetical protein
VGAEQMSWGDSRYVSMTSPAWCTPQRAAARNRRLSTR